jgi:hypothetical protein
MKVAIIRLVWGFTLLVVPGEVERRLGGGDDRRGRLVLRVLGARHLVQGALALRDGATPALAPVVDATHAATALGLAVFDRRRRSPAAADAAIAAAFALAGARAGR